MPAVSEAMQELTNKIAKQSTSLLIDIAKTLNTDTTSESIITCIAVERELEKRLSTIEFVKLLDDLYEELC